MSDPPRLLLRATAKGVKQASTMAATLRGLAVEELVAEYEEAMESAPRRSEDGHTYLRERSGRPPQTKDARRREARLAMALVNDETLLDVVGEAVDLWMYEFPLFTSGGPRGIRAVDVVGHAPEAARFWVVELKIEAKPHPTHTSRQPQRGETPLRALYEALLYGAIVEANMAYIADELISLGREVKPMRPGLLVAAPTAYWERWKPNNRIGDWWTPYQSLMAGLSEQLQTSVEAVDLGRITYVIDPDERPRLHGTLECQKVEY
jgi:hypothetical protein